MTDPRTDVDPPPTRPQDPAADGTVPDLEMAPADGETATVEDATVTELGAEPAAETDEALAVADDPRSREELLVELVEASARRDEYLDDLRRSRAEFENFRKRTAREAAGAREAGRADAVGPLLDVLDDLDRTLDAADASSDEHLAKGVQLVAEKLVRTLQGQGLARIDEVGVTFDPDVHEAVQQVPAETPVDEPIVAQILRPGYRFGDRVLRPAMVAVAQ